MLVCNDVIGVILVFIESFKYIERKIDNHNTMNIEAYSKRFIKYSVLIKSICKIKANLIRLLLRVRESFATKNYISYFC